MIDQRFVLELTLAACLLIAALLIAVLAHVRYRARVHQQQAVRFAAMQQQFQQLGQEVHQRQQAIRSRMHLYEPSEPEKPKRDRYFLDDKE